MRNTFRFVCDFSFIERVLDAKTPLKLDEFGNLVARENNGSNMAASEATQIVKATLIPLSIKNLQMLCDYPLSGDGNKHIFLENNDPWEAFEQCDTCAPTNSVYFMRRSIVEQTRNEEPDEQVSIVKAGGAYIGAPELELTSFRIRALANAVDLFERGTCADAGDGEQYINVRFPDTFFSADDDRFYNVVIGGFSLGDAMQIRANDWVEDYDGVVPGGPAKLYRPEQQVKAAEKAHGKKRSRFTDLKELEERKVESKRE